MRSQRRRQRWFTLLALLLAGGAARADDDTSPFKVTTRGRAFVLARDGVEVVHPLPATVFTPEGDEVRFAAGKGDAAGVVGDDRGFWLDKPLASARIFVSWGTAEMYFERELGRRAAKAGKLDDAVDHAQHALDYELDCTDLFDAKACDRVERVYALALYEQRRHREPHARELLAPVVRDEPVRVYYDLLGDKELAPLLAAPEVLALRAYRAEGTQLATLKRARILVNPWTRIVAVLFGREAVRFSSPEMVEQFVLPITPQNRARLERLIGDLGLRPDPAMKKLDAQTWALPAIGATVQRDTAVPSECDGCEAALRYRFNFDDDRVMPPPR